MKKAMAYCTGMLMAAGLSAQQTPSFAQQVTQLVCTLPR